MGDSGVWRSGYAAEQDGLTIRTTGVSPPFNTEQKSSNVVRTVRLAEESIQNACDNEQYNGQTD